MDIELDFSVPDTPASEHSVDLEDAALDKQRETHQTYLNLMPYECESYDEMQTKLAGILSKIFLCAKACDWNSLTYWDGELQCWLLMRYPLSKALRAKLVRFYYELCLMPGIEPWILRTWVDMHSRLIDRKPSSKPKIDVNDVQLDWRPLWRVLQKELWPKKRLDDASRNTVNILISLAAESSPFYPPHDLKEMMDTFLPLFTKDSALSMIVVITSFLPLRHMSPYIPPLLQLWTNFNSKVIHDRLLDFFGNIAREHVGGTADRDGGLPWKDVGIWTNAEWKLLMEKCLSSLNIPMNGKSTNSTEGDADKLADKRSGRIKKIVGRYTALAKLFVYSMSVDGPERKAQEDSKCEKQTGFLGGSQALDSMDAIITSAESFFHPSNSGPWSLCLADFLQALVTEFAKRWRAEEEPACKTPVAQRLTPAIRRAFVISLRTPSLLAMFSKDPFTMGFIQGALRVMAILEPTLVMPQLLERAIGGLEVVNETHRTTAVLTTLAVITRPLVTESIWRSGPKNLVPLLELCLPGIDLNDPIKTIYATMFISAAVQLVKIGDLSIHGNAANLLGVDNFEASRIIVPSPSNGERLPDGVDMAIDEDQAFSIAEERTLVRDSTAGFADWVTMLFRRILALYENLPEEGGRRQTTGGKSEESVLRYIKIMLDIICHHLSDNLFDLVLKLVFEYATTNAKANAVRAFNQLISCMARVKPKQTMDKFLPWCLQHIKEELRHGASSVRTTSSHAAIPSDTTFHWNMAILRGCLGYGGPVLLDYREEILELFQLLIEKTKAERGYSSTGKLITRVLSTLSTVYTLNTRFVNTDEWDSADFDQSHNLHWGRFYKIEAVKLEWHVPNKAEVDFVVEFMRTVIAPTMTRIEDLLAKFDQWDGACRNDFCRYMSAVKAAWSGVSTLCQEIDKEFPNPVLEDCEPQALLAQNLGVKAGFALTDPHDPRHQEITALRARFGSLLHTASATLLSAKGGEDHIDAVASVTKALDVFLLEYGMRRSSYTAQDKAYTNARDMNRIWNRQKEYPRIVFIKRMQVCHSARLYLHALYRPRSALDDQLIFDLVELSLSPYARVRSSAQAVLFAVSGYYTNATRLIFPRVLEALVKGTDADRMKGALYILYDKGIASDALRDWKLRDAYISTLLECQHQEKPSIQKLVTGVHNLLLVSLTEETVQTSSSMSCPANVMQALEDVADICKGSHPGATDLADAQGKGTIRIEMMNQRYNHMIDHFVDLIRRPNTHWRYAQMAINMLVRVLRRDIPPSPEVATLLAERTISPHSSMRAVATNGLIKLLAMVKARSYSSKSEDLWLNEWMNPLKHQLPIESPEAGEKLISMASYDGGNDSIPYIDKVDTGFLVWGKSLTAYKMQPGLSGAWEVASQQALQSISDIIQSESYFQELLALWAQESDNRTTGSSELELRADHVSYIKSLAKMFGARALESLIRSTEALLANPDRYKQRAGAECLAGLLRGSKHWPKGDRGTMWDWFVGKLGDIFAQIKPDTIGFWTTLFETQLIDWDPRRNKPLIEWILSLPLEFNGDSAFSMVKTLNIFTSLMDVLGLRFQHLFPSYFDLFFKNTNSSYAEIRAIVAQNLDLMMRWQWHPCYSSVDTLITACQSQDDPLHTISTVHLERVHYFVEQLPKWKKERLPAPRIHQSEYDKVGLTLLLWLWTIGHGPEAPSIFTYATPLLPEILAMTELSDHADLQTYSTAVMYLLASVTPPVHTIEPLAYSMIATLKSTSSWKIKLQVLPFLVLFYYRNMTSFSTAFVDALKEFIIVSLEDENVEVREMAAKALSGLLRCSQRESILPLRARFVRQVRSINLPPRKVPSFAESLRKLHSAIVGLCALLEAFPYSVEPWMPPLTEILAPHASDPPPISTTIRKCASEFKKTHQDTWHIDQLAFDTDQLSALSGMLIGTSYYA